jgi:glycosyltransferase involved in cell wall biosynthesis
LTYNHANVVADSIRSVLAQDMPDFELILSDDCSTDGTWETLERWAASDARIRLIRTPRNLRMPGNANFAVSHAAAPFVALLHHDDVYRSDLLRRWLDVIERYPDMGFVSNGYEIYGTGHLQVSPFAERNDGVQILERRLLPRLDSPFRGTAMIRRASWDAVGGMREQFGLLADVDLWMRLAARGSIGYVAEPLIATRHERPADYPAEYVTFDWNRHRLLYEILAANIREHYGTHSLEARAHWLAFRARMSKDVAYWLAYSVAKRRWDLLVRSDEVVTAYELPPVSALRWSLKHAARWLPLRKA